MGRRLVSLCSAARNKTFAAGRSLRVLMLCFGKRWTTTVTGLPRHLLLPHRGRRGHPDPKDDTGESQAPPQGMPLFAHNPRRSGGVFDGNPGTGIRGRVGDVLSITWLFELGLDLAPCGVGYGRANRETHTNARSKAGVPCTLQHPAARGLQIYAA
jgi:hypothetical protein